MTTKELTLLLIKVRADAIDEFARAYEHVELIGCENCEREDDDIPCWRCVAEQLKEQNNDKL